MFALPVVQSPAGFGKSAGSLHVVQDGIEDAVHELTAPLGAEELCQFDRFVHRDLGRDFPEVEQLADPHAKDQPVQDGDALEIPVGDFLFDDLVDLDAVIDRLDDQPLGKIVRRLVVDSPTRMQSITCSTGSPPIS